MPRGAHITGRGDRDGGEARRRRSPQSRPGPLSDARGVVLDQDRRVRRIDEAIAGCHSGDPDVVSTVVGSRTNDNTNDENATNGNDRQPDAEGVASVAGDDLRPSARPAASYLTR